MKFPLHLYRVPGPYRRKGVTYDVAGAADEDELAVRLRQGWFLTLDEARGIRPADRVVEAAEALEQALDGITPPTRRELEQKARELGIKSIGRMRDDTLADRIAEALD